MAQVTSSVSALRAYTYRLTSAPPKQLPKVASQIAGAIWNCKDVLSSPSDAKHAPDASSVVHRYKTFLSTLLQDRTIEGRWSAVVLVKSTIEAGGLEVLAKSNPWVRSLLAILKKPDPSTTRYLAVLTLTRIFMLTWDYSNLVREITTPALTAFVPTCIANMDSFRCSAQELEAVLDAFSLLLPKHPNVFRAHEAKLRATLAALLSANSSLDDSDLHHYSESQQATARKVLVLLHSCVPKQGAGDKWQETVRAAVLASHATCDRIFRAVVEDWRSSADVEPSLAQHLILNGDVEIEGEDLAGLKPWKGVFAGAERLKSLLRVIECHLTTTTPATVTVRLGLIADLLARVFGITVPQLGKGDTINFNGQIAKDERDALFAVLPDIHVSAVQLASTIITRFGSAAFPYSQNIVDQIVPVFQAQRSQSAVRLAIYSMLDRVINLAGPSMLRHEVAEFDIVLRCCCEEVLTSSEATKDAKSTCSSNGINQQLGLEATEITQTQKTNQSELKKAATQLLRTTLLRLDSKAVSPSLRAQIDRVIVLTRSKDALIASVINPPSKQKDHQSQESLLPILARECSDAIEVEAILRPRMPTISSGPRTTRADDADHSEDESIEDDQMEIEDGQDDVTSMKLSSAVEQAKEHRTTTSPLSSTRLEDDTSFGVDKRRAPDGPDIAMPAKRLRASPISEGPVSPPTTVPLSYGLVADRLEDSRIAMEQEQVYEAKVAKEEDRIMQSAGDTEGLYDAEAAESEDGDFEMPPLTMEPDTEDENEDQ